jgi:hypothetical protein
MTRRAFVLRFLCWLTMAVWVGGFTFYGAGVLPVLHDEMDTLQAGAITQRVTDRLNVVGASALAVWWLAALVGRQDGPRRTRLALLSASTGLLVFLVVWHAVMDRRLEESGLRGFYPLHRVYLLASTAQWVVNLALGAISLAAPRAVADGRS